jgi:hypothetical protein
MLERTPPRPLVFVLFGFGVYFAILALTSSSGCGWERAARISIEGAYDVGKAAEAVAIPALHEQAMAAAKKCADAKATTCPAKDEKQSQRHEVEAAIVLLYRTVLLARTAVLLGQETDAVGLISKGIAEVSALKNLLTRTGVTP